MTAATPTPPPDAGTPGRPRPKLGPNAIPLTEATDFLRNRPAPNYWAFSPFVKPQFTSSACSVASVAAALNGLRGLPGGEDEAIPTQAALLDLTGNPDWSAVTVQGGDGVRFDQLVAFTAEALAASGLAGYTVAATKPADTGEAAVKAARAVLAANEGSAADALLVYFNQGVVTGGWDGPHVSLIGAFDADTDRVLILEVDQEWHIAYWTPLPVLVAAMARPTSAAHGPLAGETGGLVRIARDGG